MLTALEDDMDQMKDVVETAITGFSDIAAEYHLNQKDRQCTVRFEPRFMCRALTNLSRNAAKYASCCIRISFEKRGPDCVIHVDDDVLAFPKRIANESSGPFWR
jgi:K+-sensing histidine kinase KdpD